MTTPVAALHSARFLKPPVNGNEVKLLACTAEIMLVFGSLYKKSVLFQVTIRAAFYLLK